ncbi:MAG: thiamine-phosphate kinase, partial [Flavobacteriales bacterium]|nr:thiamine-phosphate kinase [Flavobacteriales bacterium]
ASHPSTLKGIGDDAAVIDAGDHVKLVGSDMLVEGVHFDLSYSPLKHLGYKAAVVNFSDIYAMNGQVKQITVSVALSNRFSLEAVEELYSGIVLACQIYGVDLVGGDTVSSNSGLIIGITAIGEAQKEEVVYRNGAKDKELLVVTGDLGAAYMGLQILEREKAVFRSDPNIQPDLEGNDYILERQLKPEARKDMIELLQKLNVKPTSMIDVSDGLASEVLHLCKSSGLGCQLFGEKIPIDPTVMNAAEDFNLDPTTCALNGGEDYELLFTVQQSDYDRLKANPNFTFIGHMSEGSSAQLVTKSGQSVELTAQGWDAFLHK